MGAYKTSVPQNTDKSGGSAVSDPLSLTESGLATSDTEQLATMFPQTPYLVDYNAVAVNATADKVLHPTAQQGKVGWAPPDVKLNFTDPNAPDQTDLGTDEVPAAAYAPYPNPENKDLQPAQPPGFDPQQPSDGLKKPKIEGPKLYTKIGEALNTGINIHQGS